MSDITYCLENAKSGRSSCKKCKTKIEKGSLRIGVQIMRDDIRMTSWYKPECFTLPRKLVKEGITEEIFVKTMLIDECINREISDEELIQKICSKVKGGGSSSKDTSSGDDPVTIIKQNLERIRKMKDMDGEDEVEKEGKKRGKKKAKKEENGDVLSKEDLAAVKAFEIYENYKNDELKDVLRWNKQMVSGSKKILLQRIIDGHLNGKLGPCNTCEKGKLRLGDDNWDVVTCRGYFDESLMVRNPCFFKCTRMQAPRLDVWHTEEPPEDEEDDAKVEKETEDSNNKDSPISKLQTSAQKLDDNGSWDLSNGPGMKSSAKAMVKLCSDILDLPSSQSKATMEVGKLVVQNKSCTAKEFVVILVEKFGFMEANEDKKQSRANAATAACENEANGPLMAAMLELAEFYFKEKNTNAGITYKKVAETIKNLSFEITEDNAKGLGKGKTKVAGIGKSSADKMYEFVTTGTMEKLEEKRACAM